MSDVLKLFHRDVLTHQRTDLVYQFGGMCSLYMAAHHIASGNGRRYPLPGDGESYGALFAALRAAGYNARMSIEGKTENIAQDGKAALAYMKQLEADNG